MNTRSLLLGLTAAAVLTGSGSGALAQSPAPVPASGPSDQKPAPPKRTAFYVDPAVLDLIPLVAAPPAQDSETTRREIAENLRLEHDRTPAQAAAAQADDREEDIFVYANVLGPRFTKADLPLTAELSTRVHNDEGVVSGPLKRHYNRPRPFHVEAALHPVCKMDNDPAYPSGHSLSGYLLAYTLAEIVPEKSQEILRRADDYAHNRLVCGVHYASDAEASRRVAYVMFGYMMANPRFHDDLAAARAATRAQLGLPALR